VGGQIVQHKIVSQSDWLKARKALLTKEKEFTRARDALSVSRRELPWTPVEKNYAFDGPNGKETLSDLFGGKSQLVVYHFMLGPGWVQGCPSCSFLADHFDGAVVHLAQRDVSFVVISRAPLMEIGAYKKRMGWKFKWVSSFENDFNHDFHVSFTKEEVTKGAEYNYKVDKIPSEELPGLSAFIRDNDGKVFHTYSSYARGLDILVGTYNFLDMASKGRDEGALPWTMAWVRRHDEYEDETKSGSCCAT
jgi:predicted dithiol-disulfide oxidoreductase (DUF899 family)